MAALTASTTASEDPACLSRIISEDPDPSGLMWMFRASAFVESTNPFLVG